MTGRFDAVRDVAAHHACAAQDARELTPETIRALVAAGFTRHFVPAAWGGDDGGHVDVVRAVTTVAEGCASAAWCASVFAYAGRMAAFLPPDGQRDLWSDSPDPVVVAGLQPTGRAVADAGGWRVTGRWSYVSGVTHCDWALLLVPAVGEGGGTQRRFFAVPRADFTVADTWRTAGMRGTGSHTVVAADVRVPPHRSFPAAALDDPDTGVPLRTVAGLTFAPPLVGSARAVLRLLAPDLPTGGTEVSAPILEFVRASGDTTTAERLLAHVARAADRAGRHEGDAVVWARWAPWDCARAAELARDSVDRLLRIAGSKVFADDHPVQRIWRDVHTGASHVRLRPELAAQACLPALGKEPVRDLG